jgi:hypothetical protein
VKNQGDGTGQGSVKRRAAAVGLRKEKGLITKIETCPRTKIDPEAETRQRDETGQGKVAREKGGKGLEAIPKTGIDPRAGVLKANLLGRINQAKEPSPVKGLNRLKEK